MIEELQRHVGQVYRIIEEVNARVIALAMAKVDTKTLAKFLLDIEGAKKYQEDFNQVFDDLIQEKRKADLNVGEDTKKAIENAAIKETE